MKSRFSYLILLFPLLFSACASAPHLFETQPEEEENPAASVGERLFLETRFAQFFFQNFQGGFNNPLAEGDPALEFTQTLDKPLSGPFQGQSMNCAACHLVDQRLHQQGGGMRTYNDFAERSPIPDRGDGRLFTPRNSPPLVNASAPRLGETFFHLDGEFATMVDLVKATLTGRNYGWLPQEKDMAIAHVAAVLRQDSGQDLLAQDFGGFSYQQLLSGVDVPGDLKIPPSFRIDLATASDQEIFDDVARLIAAYVVDLNFARNPEGKYYLSPFDFFLEKNFLPGLPGAGESPRDFSRRLIQRVEELSDPKFVQAGERVFAFHEQDYVFGPQELEGMKIFFREAEGPLNADQIAQGGVGNCLACHAAPDFTDFRFHNTGATQEEYDQVHGTGEFKKLFIPGLAERNANPDLYLSPTALHPEALGMFLAIPNADQPGFTDLGMWNVFANAAIPGPQASLSYLLCLEQKQIDCSPETLLDTAVANFKTPGLRDLGHSQPYMHTGKMHTLHEVLKHYQVFSNLAREGKVRNAAPELSDIALTDQDLVALEAFLKALNEDYE